MKLKLIILLLFLLLIPGWLPGASDTLNINIIIHNVVSAEERQLPTAYALHPPYPNPFNPDVNIRVDIPEETQVRVSIFNLRGQEIAVLENKLMSPGRYAYQWQGAASASGIYFARIKTEQFEKSEKISLLK